MKLNKDLFETNLDDFRDNYEVVELREGRLWCIENKDESWTELHFVMISHSSDEGTFVDTMFRIHGPSGVLREGRHSYFPDEGYLFYLHYDNMVSALGHCKKYFDMN